MLTQSALKIELHRRGKIQSFELQAERALVGSGSHCDLRLHQEEAAVEQLVLELRDESVHAEALAFEPPCLLNGAPFFGGRLSPDSLLELGAGVALRVESVASSSARARPTSSARTHPAVQGLGLLLVLGGLLSMLFDPRSEASVLAETVSPPELPSYHAECSHGDQVQAAAAAAQALADAENKRERSPFVASDGLRAVELYARASGCLRVAGDEQAARVAERAALSLRKRLADELHVRHVRIERLLAEEKYASIPLEVRSVQELVPDRAHPYAGWLSRIEREAELRNNDRERR